MKKFLENHKYFKDEKGSYIKVLEPEIEPSRVHCRLMIIVGDWVSLDCYMLYEELIKLTPITEEEWDKEYEKIFI